jgi:predicted unusual protein kinase regulating ubiquinone biosynthesis (AarF/ABC1/UbiB family)
MASLYEHNTESGWKDVEQVLVNELGVSWESNFKSFCKKPLKVGSIA